MDYDSYDNYYDDDDNFGYDVIDYDVGYLDGDDGPSYDYYDDYDEAVELDELERRLERRDYRLSPPDIAVSIKFKSCCCYSILLLIFWKGH